jgi:predicted nuclease with TOPRIM domain
MAKHTVDLTAAVITRDDAIEALGAVHTDMQKDIRQMRAQIEHLQEQLSDVLGEYKGLDRVWNRIHDGEATDDQLSAWVEEFTGYSPAVLDPVPCDGGVERVDGCTAIMHPVYCHCGDGR